MPQPSLPFGITIISGGLTLGVLVLVVLLAGSFPNQIRTAANTPAPTPTYNAANACVSSTIDAWTECITDDPNEGVSIGDDPACDQKYAKTCQKCFDVFGDPIGNNLDERLCRELIDNQTQ